MLGVSQAYTTSSAPRLVFWGRFVVGSCWCAGHGGLGRVYDSVWTEAYRCTGELERL